MPPAAPPRHARYDGTDARTRDAPIAADELHDEFACRRERDRSAPAVLGVAPRRKLGFEACVQSADCHLRTYAVAPGGVDPALRTEQLRIFNIWRVLTC